MYSFSKKQANVIYGAWKRNEIEVEKELIDKIYYYAENGIDGYSNTCFDMNSAICSAVKAIFNKDFVTAQKRLNWFATEAKLKEAADRINAESAKRLRQMA